MTLCTDFKAERPLSRKSYTLSLARYHSSARW
jgi:hypothetical protein